MSRSIIDAAKALARSLLGEDFDSKNALFTEPVDPEKRAEHAERISKSKISTVYTLPFGVRVFNMSLQDSCWLVYVGIEEKLPDSVFEDEFFEFCELDEPFFLIAALSAKLGLKKSTSRLDIQQHLNGPVDSGEKIDILDVSILLESVNVVKIANNSVLFGASPIRQSAILFSFLNTFSPIYSVSLIGNDLRELLISQIPDTVIDNILLALVSPNHRHGYFEIYRCFEAMFQVPRALSLYQSIPGISDLVSFSSFVRSCESELAWRPKHRGSMVELIEHIGVEGVNEIGVETIGKCTRFSEHFPCDDLSGITKIAEKLVEIRNDLVHSISSRFEFSDPDWEKVIGFMLKGLVKLYHKPEFQ